MVIVLKELIIKFYPAMKTNINKSVKAFLIIGIISIGVYACIVQNQEPINLLSTKTFDKTSKVNPPLKGVDIPYEIYKVEANTSSVLTYHSGSKILIPKNAFVDKDGNLISGSVDVKYREFHNPSDFFISGIPMTYDSAGVQYHFESAGMLEILAYQNGEPVFINSQNQIVVEMASKQLSDKYNIYQYDSILGDWEFKYKDNAGLAVSESNMNMQQKKIRNNELIVVNEDKLFEPQKSNINNFRFNVETNPAEFPEMQIYDGVEFEVVDGQKEFNPNYCNFSWTDIEISKKQNSENYLMTLASGTVSHAFEVQPVFVGAAYEKAFAKYQNLLEQRKIEQRQIQKQKDSIFLLYAIERDAQVLFAKNRSKNETEISSTQNVILRTFNISGFGIWNSDCPGALPKGAQFAANYVDSTGKKIEFKTIYLVEKGRNAMFAITAYSRLYYDPSKKNILWAVTSDNKIAIFKEDDFKNIKVANDKANIQMKIIDKQITKAYEVKNILEI